MDETVEQRYYRVYTMYLLAEKGSEQEQFLRSVLELYSRHFPNLFPTALPGGRDAKEPA